MKEVKQGEVTFDKKGIPTLHGLPYTIPEETITFEELVKKYEKEHLDLIERSKTEPISWVEIMRPVQLIYNLSMNKYWETIDKINKTT